MERGCTGTFVTIHPDRTAMAAAAAVLGIHFDICLDAVARHLVVVLFAGSGFAVISRIA